MFPRLGFIAVILITLATFSAGFGVCLFNLDTVDACVDLAASWLDTFHQIASSLIARGMSIFHTTRHS